MIVVDTSVWIDYVNGTITPQTNLVDIELESNRIITGDLIITEFLQGFRSRQVLKFTTYASVARYCSSTLHGK